jgi:DNA-directed RNA polymerase subunit beta
VPESFKVLVKELQSLCLDIKILDKDGNEIELREDDDDDVVYAAGGRENFVTDEDEVLSSGFAVDPDSDPDDGMSALKQILGGDADDDNDVEPIDEELADGYDED